MTTLFGPLIHWAIISFVDKSVAGPGNISKIGLNGQIDVVLDKTIKYDPKIEHNSNFSFPELKPGNFFNDGLHFPKNSDSLVSYSSGVWLGALNDKNEELVAATTHSSFQESLDFQYGIPFNGQSILTEKIVLSRVEIKDFRNKVKKNKHCYVIHKLSHYPGYGNKNYPDSLWGKWGDLGFPFVDFNEDGIYDFSDGDYPKLEGDVSTFYLINDFKTHNLSYGKSLGALVLTENYSFFCTNTQLRNTLFFNVVVSNKSKKNWKEFYFGLWNDSSVSDINISTKVGTDTLTNSVYTYYKELNLNSNRPKGIQLAQFFDKQITSSIAYQNSGIGAPPSGATEPNFHKEYFNYLKGIFRDSTPMRPTGLGYNPNSTLPTTKIFMSGNPAFESEWNMCQVPKPTNIKNVMSHKTNTGLKQGASFQIHFGFSFHPIEVSSCPDITKDYQAALNQQQYYFDNNILNTYPNLGPDIKAIYPLTLNPNIDAISYLWSTGETTSSIEVDKDGIYQVTITDEAGCMKTDEVFVSSSLSNKGRFAKQIKTYPNPAYSYFNIEIDEPIEKVTISDLNGRVLLNFEHQKNFDVSNLKSGMYFITLKTNNSYWIRLLFHINKS